MVSVGLALILSVARPTKVGLRWTRVADEHQRASGAAGIDTVMRIARNGSKQSEKSPGQHGLAARAKFALKQGFCQFRDMARSEERRVGKECRSRWSAY